MTDVKSTEETASSGNNLMNILECSTCKKQYSTAAAREKHKCPWCSNCQRLYSTYQKYQQHRNKCLEKSKAQVLISNDVDVDKLYKSLFPNDSNFRKSHKKQTLKTNKQVPKPLSKNFENTATMLKALGTDIKPIENESTEPPPVALPLNFGLSSQPDLAQVLAWRQLMTMVSFDMIFAL